MDGTPGSLGQGLVGIGDPTDDSTYTRLYQVSNRTICYTSQIQFTNTSSGTVVLNVYKKVSGVYYLLSPNNFSFGGNYLAQEDSPITLNANDGLFAVCNTDEVVSFLVNGYEIPI